MKFPVSILLIALLSFVSCLYLPWWTIALTAFLVTALIHQPSWKSFLSGFIALFLLWMGLAWYISSSNEHLLARKVSVLIVQTDNTFLLILLTALIGAITAGFGALAGSYLNSSSARDTHPA